MVDQLVEKLQQKALSRRNFLASIGVASAATLVGCSDSSSSTSVPVTTPLPAAAVTAVAGTAEAGSKEKLNTLGSLLTKAGSALGGNA